MKNNELILFDFCETLIKFQTADRYVHFCRRCLGKKRMLFFHFFIRCLEKLNFFKLYDKIFRDSNLHKRLVLFQLKGVEKKECEELAKKYFEEELLPNVIPETIQMLKRHQENNNPVWLISGGYDLYIKYFADYFHVDEYICSHIQFNEKSVCTGKMNGLDCMGTNKLLLLETFLKERYDVSSITFYSDSSSDLPLLLRAQTAVVVSKIKHQSWIDQYQLKEIIWS